MKINLFTLIKFIFDSYETPILIGLFIILFIVETKFQLRKRVQNRWKRIVINFIVSLPAFVLLGAIVYTNYKYYLVQSNPANM